MRNKAIDTVKKYNMLTKGDRVVVGLSGGADSCALLHFLVSLKKDMNITVYACHINHLLRGEEAERDELFVTELCKRYDVRLFKLRADVGLEAQKRKIGTEQCGRDIRYDFFRKTAESLDAKIATAHTASDNAETVIFNLTRGSGIAGLCGIPPVRNGIVRPLIEVTRQEVEKYCTDNNISYVTDSTNLTHDYTRNKIRLDVIPILKQINPMFEMSVSGMSGRMRETEHFLSQSAETALKKSEINGGYDAKELLKLENAVFNEAVRLMLKKINIVPDSKHIELVKKIVYNNGAVEIKKNIFAVSKQGILRIYEKKNQAIDKEVPYNNQKSLSVNHRNIKLEILNMEEINNGKKNNDFLFYNLIDYDTIPVTAVFRLRRSGDVFFPLNRNVRKPLRRLMSELKIPSERRDGLVLLAEGSNIIWAEDIGVSEPYKITQSTENVLFVSAEKEI